MASRPGAGLGGKRAARLAHAHTRFARLLRSRHLFCVVTTTVVFVGVSAVALLDFFHENGSRTAISDSSRLTTVTSRNRPMTKLEKQSRRSSRQRPGSLGGTRRFRFRLTQIRKNGPARPESRYEAPVTLSFA